MQPFERLEVEWAEANELDPAGMVACSSGTAALHLALEALNLYQRPEPGWNKLAVAIPDYTMIACARAVAMTENPVRLLDCCPKRLVVANESLSRDLPYDVWDASVCAAMMVHVYGRRCDMVHAALWSNQYHQYLIEDLAEAHGVKPHSETDAACWSFYRNKIVAGEEGGAVWFKDPADAKLARQLRSLGFTDDHDYTHVPRGHNYRMSNLHAGRILDRTANRWGALGEMRDNLDRRRIVEQKYDACCPAEWRQPERDAVWVYDFRVPGMTRTTQTRVVRALQAAGIAARFGFWPMSVQVEFSQKKAATPNAWKAATEVVYLPVDPSWYATPPSFFREVFDLVEKTLATPPA